MFVRVNAGQFLPGKAEEGIALVAERSTQVEPGGGRLGLFVLGDKASGKVKQIVLWDSEAAALKGPTAAADDSGFQAYAAKVRALAVPESATNELFEVHVWAVNPGPAKVARMTTGRYQPDKVADVMKLMENRIARRDFRKPEGRAVLLAGVDRGTGKAIQIAAFDSEAAMTKAEEEAQQYAPFQEYSAQLTRLAVAGSAERGVYEVVYQNLAGAIGSSF